MAKQESPTVQEQAQEILLILDKEQMLLQALAGTDVEGKLKSVPPTPEHNNDFLRLNGSDNWLESFATNFFSQAKDPTKFSLLKLKERQLDDPLVRRAMADIEQGRITADVMKFLEKYQINPNTNPQKPQHMAQQENPQPTRVEDQQPPRYRFNEAMVDWKQVEAFGITREWLEQRGMYDPMMRGFKSATLVPITTDIAGTSSRYEARISFRQLDDGRIVLQTHPLRQAPDFTRPFLGHNFSEDDKINLTSKAGNMGRVVPLKTSNGWEDCFVSIDKLTNQIVAAKVEGAFIADEYSGYKLDDYQKQQLREGKAIAVEGLISKSGKEFNTTLQYNAERRGVEYLFPDNLRFEHGQELGKVKLTDKQVDDFNAGKAIFVEHMVRRDGELFSSYLKRDEVSGKIAYSRVNPDNPAEVYIPLELNGVKVTPEERQQLREGKALFLNNMTNARGEEFSSWVKIDMNSGYPMYAKTPDGFEEKREFKIPAEVFGVTLSATQRADLQDGKAVLIEGMKGNNGVIFSQWAKVNPAGNKLNYYNEHPDIKRDATSRNVAQTAKSDQGVARRKGQRL